MVEVAQLSGMASAAKVAVNSAANVSASRLAGCAPPLPTSPPPPVSSPRYCRYYDASAVELPVLAMAVVTARCCHARRYKLSIVAALCASHLSLRAPGHNGVDNGAYKVLKIPSRECRWRTDAGACFLHESMVATIGGAPPPPGLDILLSGCRFSMDGARARSKCTFRHVRYQICCPTYGYSA